MYAMKPSDKSADKLWLKTLIGENKITAIEKVQDQVLQAV